MTGAGIPAVRRSLLCAAFLGLLGQTALAHNNPSMKETLVRTVPIAPAADGGPVSSEPFQLKLPPRTVEILWKVVADRPDDVRFDVEADGKTVATDVHHGKATPLIRADTIRLMAVRGAGSSLEIEVFANVMEKR
ncbi:hypothetical protein IGS68_28310 (plasmid) [Skermanella sp. TT6]|uniref:Copper resistance protein CopC n=1 Tax=Skermanella cutis TaxID=2775420 RepID=A0ABX7BFA8_9PROT|nr:hypothetical protein [Skermanella sp. TT6]QQP93067.1 hypothetical protein IGS68_28310 [Skermanella sp. TT6]